MHCKLLTTVDSNVTGFYLQALWVESSCRFVHCRCRTFPKLCGLVIGEIHFDGVFMSGHHRQVYRHEVGHALQVLVAP